MAARSALGRAPHKTAGGLLLTAGVTIVMGIITAEALYTNPYNARMEISDLGATEIGEADEGSSDDAHQRPHRSHPLSSSLAWPSTLRPYPSTVTSSANVQRQLRSTF
jgi:hypothetical protein